MLLSEHLCTHHDWLDVARAAVDAGVDCLQLREKHLPGGELVRRTHQLLNLARPHGVSVILNDRPDAALVAGADGVHLGQSDLPCREVRKWVGSRLLIGVSTSRLEEARRAADDGADYVGLGPMFPTSTAPDKTELAGPAYLRRFREALALPHLAIGGVTPDNVAELVDAGARGVAVSSAVCGAQHPGEATRRLLEALPASL
ncbi:MAG: thiamine phosphate synthase [Phycisphaeraceae bacterium]